ncbi:membrane fusion protein, multidrug efflux system [Collimonas sp. OK242]|uniref:HlyD family secretion protein n=1 Tax=Collimonas sp. OK242 TaxID=1798195 RepID=UPI00089CF8FD|nr:HlyD family secretion protein [Collimonas sp. OK242]SDY85367.1 membrane fusion protein, multidrug efflux system [Collimonas sp. OK242]
MNQPTNVLNANDTPNATRGRRKPLFALLALSVALIGGGGWTYWELVASRHISTDNAYTGVESAELTPSITGTIAEVRVTDTQSVKKGDVLVVIDPADAKLTLAQADADLGRAVRHVKSLEANDTGLGAQVLAHEEEEKRLDAQLAAAQADFERADIDLKRRQALVASGSVSGDELTRAQNAYASAMANLKGMKAAVAQAHDSRDAAVGAKQSNAALFSGADLDSNPEVALARAKRDQAALDLERTIIRSPVDGIIAKRQVQLGQKVQAGTPLLSVVPIQNMHVDANFKEVQLKKVKAGQPATVRADIYGESVTYHGVVEGFSGGTGAAFSLIPAQNATGNWIKVVQRLPVRIRLEPAELLAHPLRVGMSTTAEIDLNSKS